MSANALIELQDVSKLFGFGDATTLALDEVNVKIDKNEFVAIMGPSGSGKSTLMNIIGLLDHPTHGNFQLNGRSVAKLSSNQRAKIRRDTIGFIFQSYNLLTRMTVLENVALPLAYKGMTVNRRLKAASNMLERVGMQEREYFYPNQLSGGQVQCAAIARALVNNPKLIIADEPTGNLDSEGSRLVMELLSEVHKMGNTILFVTHNPELTRYASRVVYMRDGSIIQDEATLFGEVAATALKDMYSIQRTTVEDDLAGISALMKAVPGPASPYRRAPTRKTATKRKPRKTTRKTTTRRKTGAAK
ncbi:MAG TPA: ABC transporter ATP-binding protein [Candidatus Saccharimonadales bacterium]|nr:ABC transporter ATP-binding protein [Candidatus Saccharimonadales bacterium]